MKIEVDRSELIKAMTASLKAVGGKTCMPILSDLLFEAGGGRLKITGYDLEIGIVTEIPADIGESGSICADGGTLAEFLSKCSDSKVHMENDDSRLKIKCGKSRVSISTMSAEDFPAIPEIETIGTFEITKNDLTDLITETSYCAADSSPKPILTGINLKVEKGWTTAAAVDGFRFSEYKIPNTCETSGNVTIPKKTAKILSAISGDASVTVGKNMILFNSDGIKIYGRLLVGDYVDYIKTLPAEYKQKFEVDADKINSILAKILTLKEDKKPLRLVIENERALFLYDTNTSNFQEEIEIRLEGEPATVGIDVKFLSEAFKGADKVIVECNGDSRPIVLKEGNKTQMIMPMRLKA